MMELESRGLFEGIAMRQPKVVLNSIGRPFEVILGTRRRMADVAPGFKTWREVGWIFRDGECIAIERHGEEIRSRVLVDS